MPIFRGKQLTSSNSDYKDSARAALRSNLNLAASVSVIDGVTLNNGDRVLLVKQNSAAENGIYTWSSTTSKLTRATDADSSGDVSAGMRIYVEEGTVNAKSIWIVISTGQLTVGSSAIVFANDGVVNTTDLSGTYGSQTKTLEISLSETGQITAVTEHTINGLPSQTGNSGKYLKTNGTVASWETVSASGGSNSYNDLTDKPNFATVATSGSYTDLINKPTIPSVPTTVSSFTNDAGYLTSVGPINYNDLTNQPTLFSGAYADLTGKPTLFSGAYADLTGKPSLSTVATSGSYNDLTDKPSSSSNQYTLTGTTTNATETEIFVEGVSNSRIAVSVNTTAYYNIDIVARRTDSFGDHAAFYIKGVVNNNAGTTADIGSLYEVIVARTDAGLSVDVRADNTTDTINIYVTGVANKTFSWKCVVTKIEV